MVKVIKPLPLSGLIQQMTMIFYLFFTENRILHFMQIVSNKIVPIGDNFHEMSKPVFWEKWEKYKMYFKMSSAETFTKSSSTIMTLQVSDVHFV